MQKTTLANDIGKSISFVGELRSESSSYDDENGELTLQRIYLTDKDEIAYHVITGRGGRKERRAYLLKVEGDICRISTGSVNMDVDINNLSSIVRGLCGLDNGVSLSELEERMLSTLKAKDNAVNE